MSFLFCLFVCLFFVVVVVVVCLFFGGFLSRGKTLQHRTGQATTLITDRTHKLLTNTSLREYILNRACSEHVKSELKSYHMIGKLLGKPETDRSLQVRGTRFLVDAPKNTSE